MVDAATDSPNAPERGGEKTKKKSGVGAKKIGVSGVEWLEWWLSGPDPGFELT